MSFLIEIASVPDREELVAEIWHGEEMVAEIRQGAKESFMLEIYPRQSGEPWLFKLQEWVDILDKARSRLA